MEGGRLIDIVVIDTPSLGDRSYLATDGSVAIVIDPQRDIDRVLALAQSRGVLITHVFETHIHNDYVTGGLALALATGAAYHVNGADQVSFDRIPVAGGDKIDVGEMRVLVIATPGHTFNHLSYAVRHAGRVVAVFTGGSLLNGSTGRTDLLGPEHAVELARAQHGSARRLAAELPPDAMVCPTHGFGSFCSATPTSGTATTIGMELAANPALTLDEEDYVESTLAALDVYPAYYAHMAPANSAGPAAPDLSLPEPADSAELRSRIEAGEWVVDLRSRVAFAAGHVRGTLQFELGDSLPTYLGWLIPWGTPLTLLGATRADVTAAQRDLVRIGIDQVQSVATGRPEAWSGDQPLASYPVTDFAGLARACGRGGQDGQDRQDRQGGQGRQGVQVLLDVRRQSEWDAARIEGAVHIPLHELPRRIGEIGAGEIWVHCQSGYRASVAASLLDAAGRSVVLIDDDFSRAQEGGLAGAGTVPAY
jgi:glyoxylase-like metal-dependent hydrolase (beta-lactamase superfamily II)/rhodanese-related sulfurtransferase